MKSSNKSVTHDVALNLRFLISKGYTQIDIATELGVEQSTVSKLLNEKHEPSASLDRAITKWVQEEKENAISAAKATLDSRSQGVD